MKLLLGLGISLLSFGTSSISCSRAFFVNVKNLNEQGEAFSLGNDETVLAFIERQSDVNKFIGGIPLISLVISAHSLKGVQRLIDKRADVNRRDAYQSNTPLHFAVEANDSEMCCLLLNNGANQDVTNKDNETPLLLAARKGFTEICELFTHRRIAQIFFYFQHKNCKLISSQQGSQVAQLDDQVRQSINLCRLVGSDDKKIKKSIVQKDGDGMTILHHAAYAGDYALCEKLLKMGVNILDVDNGGA